MRSKSAASRRLSLAAKDTGYFGYYYMSLKVDCKKTPELSDYR
jgi:hypothetical protein